jgi:anti-anti-sigma factor
LNLRDVTYLDSTGIGELFGCLTTVQSHGGVLKVSSPSERVLHLLRLTKLNTVIDVMEDEAAAVQSFARAGAA